MERIWIRSSVVYLFICIVSWFATLFIRAGLYAILFGSIILVGSLIMWVTGLVYLNRPAAANGLIGKFHFGMFQLGVPCILLAWFLSFMEVSISIQVISCAIGIAFLMLGLGLFLLNIVHHHNYKEKIQ